MLLAELLVSSGLLVVVVQEVTQAIHLVMVVDLAVLMLVLEMVELVQVVHFHHLQFKTPEVVGVEEVLTQLLLVVEVLVVLVLFSLHILLLDKYP